MLGIILKDMVCLNYKTQKLFVMKKILLIASAATIVLSACNSEKKDSLNTDKQVVFTDTSSLKQGNASTDIPTQGVNTPANVQQTTPPPPQVKTITKVVKVYQKQPAPVVTNSTTPPVVTAPVPTTTTSNPVPTGTGTTPSTGTGTGTTPSSTTTTTTTPAKNGGWSNAAKDATIGGVGGAVVGAVIGKGAKGAIIGGVLGAAGGYILGKKKDNNNKQTTTTTTTTNP